MSTVEFWTPIGTSRRIDALVEPAEQLTLLVVPAEGEQAVIIHVDTLDRYNNRAVQWQLVGTTERHSAQAARNSTIAALLEKIEQTLASQYPDATTHVGSATVVAIPRATSYPELAPRRRRAMNLLVLWALSTLLAYWAGVSLAEVSGTTMGLMGGFASMIVGGLVVGVVNLVDGLQPRKHEVRVELAGGQALDSDNIADYARARLRGEFPDARAGADRRASARDRVAAIREEHVRLGSDIVYRIEQPALFDPTCSATARYEAAVVAWESLEPDVALDDLEQTAALVESSYAVARDNAETLGLRHLAPDQMETADRASRAARLAVGAATLGERDAALTQLNRLLSSLALFYLPPVKDIEALPAPEPPS